MRRYPAIFLFSFILLSKDPTEWRPGKLVDLATSTESKVVGVNGLVTTGIRKVFTFTVDCGDRIYEAQEIGRKAPHVEVNAPIQYSASKVYLLIKDTDGRVHKHQDHSQGVSTMTKTVGIRNAPAEYNNEELKQKLIEILDEESPLNDERLTDEQKARVDRLMGRKSTLRPRSPRRVE
jgi:hypothetical protein